MLASNVLASKGSVGDLCILLRKAQWQAPWPVTPTDARTALAAAAFADLATPHTPGMICAITDTGPKIKINEPTKRYKNDFISSPLCSDGKLLPLYGIIIL